MIRITRETYLSTEETAKYTLIRDLPDLINQYKSRNQVESIGVVRCSPKLDKARNSSKWWMVLDCDPELGRYYRHLFYVANYKTIVLRRPAWADHISIVRDEKPQFEDMWEDFNGKEIKFTYDVNMVANGIYCWLPVICEEALDIRVKLGLVKDPYFPLHLTIGNTKSITPT